MNYAPLAGGVGSAPIQLMGLNTSDTTARQMPGFILNAADPYWGSGEFIYGRANGTIAAFNLAVCTPSFDSTNKRWQYDFTAAPNTANLGRDLYVAMSAMSSGEFGWFQMSGITPVSCTASVAADTAWGIAAAGQGGAIANGKQILNSRVAVAATATVAKANATADSGSYFLNVSDSDGWFEGIYLSGTGIAAGAYVTAIAPGGRVVTMSAVTTAAVAGTVTGTYNNATIYYNVVHLNRPFAQGQIT